MKNSNQIRSSAMLAASVMCAGLAFADFKVDRSVMSEEYWKIWNDDAQAKISWHDRCRRNCRRGEPEA